MLIYPFLKQKPMTPNEFSKIVAATQAGKPQAFNRFYKELYKKCKAKLLFHVTTEAEAEDAFSEAMHKFWKKFIVEGAPLPKNNIEGYIFTIAKFYAINQQQAKKRKPIESGDRLDFRKDIEQDESKTETDFWKEQQQEDNYQIALKKGIKKLGKPCRDLFAYILKTGIDKPKYLYEPLGYNNARTVSSKKSECSKKLKTRVAIELDLLNLNQLKSNNNVNYN